MKSFTFFMRLTLFDHPLGSEKPFHIKSLIYPRLKRRIERGNRESGRRKRECKVNETYRTRRQGEMSGLSV